MNIIKYSHMFKMLIELAFEPKKKDGQRPLLLLEMMRLQSSQSRNGFFG